jgi:uncharacterized protein (DUF58 family)
VFCGDTALFSVVLDNSTGPGRVGVGLNLKGQPPVFTDVAAGARVAIDLALPAVRRGWLPIGALTVFTRYPLGLFRAWSQLRLDARCLVYPAPAPNLAAPAVSRASGGQRRAQRPGSDDFMGLRTYHPGDSPRHIDWKAAARGQTLLIKTFGDNAGAEVWLDWRDYPGQDTESRLGQLCRGVLWAEESGHAYGLILPGEVIAACSGEEHKHRCLRALALYEAAA